MTTASNNPTSSVHRLSISSRKGEKKQNVEKVVINSGGIEGDVHAGSFRAVSLLPFESFQKLDHPDLTIHPGDFAENITTTGLDFRNLIIGSRIALGENVTLEIVQIGKKCHNGCIIRETVGDCIMPREGLFAKVLTGGELKTGDSIKIIE